MVTITGYVMTPVFGGQEGELYNDVLYTNKDTGGFVVKDSDSGRKRAIDVDHPIKTIEVGYDSFVRGMSVTYRVAKPGYETASFERGIETLKKGRVDFREHDVLLAVFGRAGPASKNDSREVIHSIGFIVFNTESGETHTFGPFGHSSSAHGERFYVTNVVGFGGFHDPNSDIGLSGLFFVKDMNKL